MAECKKENLPNASEAGVVNTDYEDIQALLESCDNKNDCLCVNPSNG